MIRRRYAIAGLAVTVAGAVAAVAVAAVVLRGQTEATTGESAASATVTVDAGRDLGELNNPADYHNQSGPAWLLGPADEQKIDALAPQVVRAWIKPHHYYDHNTKQFRFDYRTESGTTTYEYSDQVAGHSETILANFDQCDQELMRLSDPRECRWVLKAGLLNYKKRYSSLRYIELFNEPDKTWAPTSVEQPALSLDDYYRWFRIGYEVVREVNQELKPKVPLEIGGPSSYTFNTEFLTGFLDLYKADNDPGKSLGFLSYHQYKQRAAPATVATERDTVRQWMIARGLDADRPVFVTEYGVFPGPNTGTTFEADLLAQAAGMATIGRYYTYSGMEMAMHWVYDHLDNERKSMLVDDVDGGVYPYYNLVLMQRMLKPRLIPAESSAVSEAGIGVNALASRGTDGIAILVTNYQWTDGKDEHDVTLAIDNLPADLAKRKVTVQRYLVDSETSNRTHDPAAGELRRVENYETEMDTSADLSFHLERNAMTLVVVTPR